MKVAIVGSRTIEDVDIGRYLNDNCTVIISGRAKGIDSCAAKYANKNQIPLVEILPEYDKYGKAAPIKRNEIIVNMADEVLVFWDGRSKGTLSVIKYCQKTDKPHIIINITTSI